MTTIRATLTAVLAASLLTLAPAPAHAASGLPTPSGTAACQRVPADRSHLQAALAVQARDTRLRPRTARQRALKAARLRKDAARVGQARARLAADQEACDARWRWPYPNSPRLDQGTYPACDYYAALQQLNMRGARISQALADHMWLEVGPQAPSATRPTQAIIADVLAAHGVRVTWRTTMDPLREVQSSPVQVALRYVEGMSYTSADGHWLVSGAYAGVSHSVVLVGYDPTRQRVLLLNQWGRWWGVDGGMWVTLAEWSAQVDYATVWALG